MSASGKTSWIASRGREVALCSGQMCQRRGVFCESVLRHRRTRGVLKGGAAPCSRGWWVALHGTVAKGTGDSGQLLFAGEACKQNFGS